MLSNFSIIVFFFTRLPSVERVRARLQHDLQHFANIFEVIVNIQKLNLYKFTCTLLGSAKVTNLNRRK